MLPTIEGTMQRRLLVNFRVDPARVAAQLPAELRPQVVDGFAIAGICIIQLREIRPVGLPRILGLASENAAHRIAVEWDTDDGTRQGVYIPHRHTGSRINALLGGRLFPGVHARAEFRSSDERDRIAVEMRSRDGATEVAVEGRLADHLPAMSIFDSVEAVSHFFAKDTIGLSPTLDGGLEGLELEAFHWAVTPLHVTEVRSSYMEQVFGDGATFDNALLMRGIRHRWHEHTPGCAQPRRPPTR